MDVVGSAAYLKHARSDEGERAQLLFSLSLTVCHIALLPRQHEQRGRGHI